MKVAKIKKIINIIILIMLTGFIVPLVSNASEDPLGELKDQADGFITRGGEGAISTGSAFEKLKPIGQILVGIGTVVLVIVGLILGLKYMMAGANEKARNKAKTFILRYFGRIDIWCNRYICDCSKNYE